MPDDNKVNAALVAQLYNNGDSIVYSTHYKNNFGSIKNENIPNSNLTARELYILGMAQLDLEVFGHNKFIIGNTDYNFGQNLNARDPIAGFTTITISPSGCEYNFAYSSATVFPPVIFYTYYTTCGSPVLLPPASFLQELDESYGFTYYSSTPIGEGGGGSASPYAIDYSIFYNGLTTVQQSFLDNVEYNEFYHGFVDYMILHQFSQASQDHIKWCINYLLSPTTLITSFSDFASVYLSDFPSLSFLSQDDLNWLSGYPYLKSRIYYYLQNSFIINAEQKIQFHISKLRTDGSYFTFNTAYSSFPQYKDVWFNDYTYLYDLGGSAFGDWAITYLMQYPSVTMQTFQNQFLPSETKFDLDYSDLENPVYVTDDVVEMPMGLNFEFENFHYLPDPPIKILGKTMPRGNEEDLDHGIDGDLTDIRTEVINLTDAQLFDIVEDLFHKTTTGSLQIVGDEMINRVRNNIGGTYSNNTLSQIVFNNSNFVSFIKDFGTQLNIALSKNNWDINNINELEIPQKRRPVFNGLYNKFNGLQILINDTEQTIIELTGFSINPTTHKWTANINVIIKDHFGLDKKDALSYQYKHWGFAAWWVLQHRRNYRPFETKIEFRMNLVADPY